MKVLFDANVFLSFMLAPDEERTITRIVRAAFEADGVQVVVPPDLIDEIIERVLNKRYFQDKISRTTLEETLTLLLSEGEPLDAMEEEYASYVQDRKDDYLVAYGLLYDVHYLVSGDDGFKGIDKIESLRIVRPVAFYRILQEHNLL